ncbi:MAG: hypothetical protein NXI24_17245 [bacterium]|nr:hypothetical protein [bacterium]
MKALNAEPGNLRDGIVAVLCTIAVAATGYSLYLDGATRLEAGDAAPAGEIDFRSGDASRRYADRALWERLDAGDIVYNRNSIRTGDGDSGASIRLNDDTRIEMDQATMIVLQINENEIRLQLKAGSLEIRRSKPRYDQALTVGRGDHVLELDSGEVRLESTEDPGMQVTPLLGSVTVRESSRRIRTGDQITLSNSGRSLRQLGIVLLSPAQGDRIAAAPTAAVGSLTPVRLAWKIRGLESNTAAAPAQNAGAAQAKDATVEVSRDPAFETIVQRISDPGNAIRSTASQAPANKDASASVGQQAVELQLADGLYYWRVRQGSERSATGKFRIVPAPAAMRIISPAPGGEIRVDSAQNADAQHAIQFAWSPQSAASHYRLEVFRIFRGADESTLERIVSQKVERDYVRVRLAPGEYRFRVQSFIPGASGRSPSSDLAHFRLVSATADELIGARASVSNSDSDSAPQALAAARDTQPDRPASLDRGNRIGNQGATSTEDTGARGESLREAAPLRLLSPANGAQIDMASKTAIVFRWRPATNAADQTVYRVRFVDLSQGGRRVLFETTTRATSARFDGLHELEHNGSYQWSVVPAGKTATNAESKADSGGAANFRVILSHQPEQPQFLTDGDQTLRTPEAEP